MRRMLIVAIVMLISTTSCTTTLYNWGGWSMSDVSDYENQTYRYFDKQTPESLCRLLCMYEDIINKPSGSRQVPPPGICAEYGYLLLTPGTAETFAQHATTSQQRRLGFAGAGSFREHGKAMLEREILLYPESAKFIRPLINKL